MEIGNWKLGGRPCKSTSTFLTTQLATPHVTFTPPSVPEPQTAKVEGGMARRKSRIHEPRLGLRSMSH